jgi:hypothetical protein
MKNRKILWLASSFAAGAILGISILGLVSFTSQPPQPGDPVITRITSADALTFYQNYIRTATTYTNKLKGFTIERTQLTMMNTILTATPTAAGFRIIFGTNASGTSIAMVCAVDATGADMTGNIYSTTYSRVGPCPPVCDVNSPISK